MQPAAASDAYLTFEGRLGRGRWIVLAGFLVALNLAVFAATWWLAGRGLVSGGVRDMTRVAVQIFTMVPWAALDWKRLHDLDRPGGLALVCPALFVLARMWEAPAVAALAPSAHGRIEAGIAWAQLLLALLLAYVYMGVKGTPGPNRFGESPGVGVPPP